MVRPGKHEAGRASGSEQLVLLKENRLAHTALGRVTPDSASYPLVYLYGAAGVGKSHLVRQFLREVRKEAPRLRVRQLTASEFAADVSAASARGDRAELQA